MCYYCTIIWFLFLFFIAAVFPPISSIYIIYARKNSLHSDLLWHNYFWPRCYLKRFFHRKASDLERNPKSALFDFAAPKPRVVGCPASANRACSRDSPVGDFLIHIWKCQLWRMLRATQKERIWHHSRGLWLLNFNGVPRHKICKCIVGDCCGEWCIYTAEACLGGSACSYRSGNGHHGTFWGSSKCYTNWKKHLVMKACKMLTGTLVWYQVQNRGWYILISPVNLPGGFLPPWSNTMGFPDVDYISGQSMSCSCGVREMRKHTFSHWNTSLQSRTRRSTLALYRPTVPKQNQQMDEERWYFLVHTSDDTVAACCLRI